MSDSDIREFFKGSNKAKKWNQKMKKDMEKRKPTFEPIVPFSSSITPGLTWEEPKPPIDVIKNGVYSEWEWMGITFRPYYAGNIWLNCDASHVYYAFHNHDTNTITSIKRLNVKYDANGKQYIENYVNKILTKIYLYDALKTVFHNGLKPVHSSVITTQMINNNSDKKNPNIFNHEGKEYAFFHEGKFCVSRKGGLACWMHLDWKVKPPTFDKIIPYNIKTKIDGGKYVDVKQEDGTYKEFDLATAVGKTFLKNPPCDDCIIKFKDGDISNCDADNLYWDMPL